MLLSEQLSKMKTKEIIVEQVLLREDHNRLCIFNPALFFHKIQITDKKFSIIKQATLIEIKALKINITIKEWLLMNTLNVFVLQTKIGKSYSFRGNYLIFIKLFRIQQCASFGMIFNKLRRK